MQKDINLTICLSFESEEERRIVQEFDKERRAENRPILAQTIINAILLSRKMKLPAAGEITLDGKTYTVTIVEDTDGEE